MAVLQRRTSNAILYACLAADSAAIVLGSMAFVVRPEARVPAMIAWPVSAWIVHRLTGERATPGNITFCALFSVVLVLAGLGAYEARTRWDLAPLACGLVFAGILLLHAAFFLRALIASGSADYPYDD